ncbi:protein trichome birefringence-like 2 [Benincasa hispida]|uniref:protein trichome birefringence-like 2 n=1 Tax=Benincasa hispida TaxID=102211 RepID=UPI0018FF9662|nr:protein trichome birefringence-like 2 [Benincasa hispida]
MDPRKLGFPEQILSPRRRVVPGFGLGISVSLIVLSFLLLYSSSHGKFFFSLDNQPTSVDSLFSSWSFSFSSPSFSDFTANSSKLATYDPALPSHFPSLHNHTRDVNATLQLNPPPANGSEFGNATFSLESKNVTANGTVSSLAKLDAEHNFPCNSTSLNNNTAQYQKENNHSSNAEDERPSEGNGGRNSSDRIEITRNSQPLATSDNSFDEECDIFDGEWVRDDSKPYYPLGSCPYIDRDFDCHLNKRPDDGYVKWKWQPYMCNIPSLNATHFLEVLRGKSLVFVGDSLNRNMWESLVCILRHNISDKKRVYEISGRTEFKKKGFYAFRFEDYNCSVDFVSSPFLVRESSFKRKNGTIETLRLDQMDPTTEMYRDADVLVFNTGHWWTHEKTSRGEDYYQEGNHVHPRLKVLEAFKRALTTWGRWIDNTVDRNRTLVFFRGYSYSHFSGGEWNSGGQCNIEMEPIYNKTHLGKYPKKMRALEYVIREMKTPVSYLNITRLTHYRKDAHPSIYRMEYKTEAEKRAGLRVQDCSHWCLPGVPDTWNELLYASLLRMAKRYWSN